MSLYTTSLNSGSNGNCYYIGNETEAVLVDAGISCREIEKRMKRLGLPMDLIKAVFISHEHKDHISGVEVLSKKYQIPVYITPKTLKNSRLNIDPALVKWLKGYGIEQIGALTITPFPKFHDAADPHSFVVSFNGINVGVFTDIGAECEHVVQQFNQCHAAFLEANYDHDMLMNGHYPFHLKNRIQSNHGHLSNHQALQIFLRYKSDFLSHLFLAHLSKENNSPELVHQLFLEHAGSTYVEVASRYKETEIYHINGEFKPVNAFPKAIQPPINAQMKLF